MLEVYLISVCVCLFLLLVKYDDRFEIDNKEFLLDLLLIFVPPVLVYRYAVQLKQFIRSRN